MTTAAPNLSLRIQVFFSDYLRAQRGLSPHTVLSYRDTFKLFLTFAAKRARKKVADLTFGNVGPETVLAFLEDLERSRKNSARTRNTRLAALHTFFRYVAAHEPQLLEVCQRISAIPVKRMKTAPAVYLEYAEVVHILGTIDRDTPRGRRDHLLLLLLFETGARAQEIASLRSTSLRLDKPSQVTLFGKGRKERICPLRASTVRLIRQHQRLPPVTGDPPLFAGRHGEPLTRHGVLRIVQRRVRIAVATMPTLAAKRVGAHTFRHAAAIHLLRSGNALPVIRSWLGHVSVTTTDRYTEIDTEMKRRAVEATDPVPMPRRRPTWKAKPDLLTWLEAL
jgi:site-specific recombinase XerD